jgi:hypothetical protein
MAGGVFLVANIVEQSTQDASEQVLHVVLVLDLDQWCSPRVADAELAHDRRKSAQYPGNGRQCCLPARAGVRKSGPDRAGGGDVQGGRFGDFWVRCCGQGQPVACGLWRRSG